MLNQLKIILFGHIGDGNIHLNYLGSPNFSKEKFPHITWKGSHFNNASGLNLNNKIGSKDMAQLLFSLQNVNFNERSFWSLLSIRYLQ